MADGNDIAIAVIGLGYVGLPLAAAFAGTYAVRGFDINELRVTELRKGMDSTLELTTEELAVPNLQFTSELQDIASCNVYIVTVPTPIDPHCQPDLRPLIRASTMLAGILGKGDVVVYESTVYPGATEDVCVPLLEEGSGLVFNRDFSVGFSPERINPGDKQRRLPDIIKVVSASNDEAADFLAELYGKIISAGIHRASCIKVAEACKVIENTQRDVNIALINELAIICGRLHIDTHEVLQAAGTKWNFLPFKPGLVGGHCIGVDPYYLTHKAQATGYHPEVILAGRRMNEGMSSYVVTRIVHKMIDKGMTIRGSKVLVLGLAFKENCPDMRNSKVVDLVREFEALHLAVDIYDPWVSSEDAKREHGLQLLPGLGGETYDVVVLAVGHREFLQLDAVQMSALARDPHVLFDVKGVLPREWVDDRL